MIKKINTLFWNTNKQNSSDYIVRVVKFYDVDILILAELGVSESSLLRNLNSKTVSFYYNSSRINKHKIKIFSKFKNDIFKPALEDSDRLTIRKLKISDEIEISIAALHMVSKLNFSDKSQQFETLPYLQDITNAERFCGHKKTIVVGDFNMNPFEEAMIAGSAFNSVMCRQIAKKKERKIQGRNYPYFYNPSWNFFGDFQQPAGTYYYSSSEHVNYKWNVFDQVLIRPELIDYFELESFQIVRHDGKNSLLSKEGIPDSKISDHLPVLFTLNFLRNEK